MTEPNTTTEGTEPRCRCGRATDNRCPRPATANAWGDGPPDICEYHDRLWNLNDDLGQAETAQHMLVLWEEQAGILSCPPLEVSIRLAREQADAEIARLEREVGETEAKERAESEARDV